MAPGKKDKRKMGYLFRIPKYPIIINIDGTVIACLSEPDLLRELERIETFQDYGYDVMDSRGEGWMFVPEYRAISPLTLNKSMTKRALIDMVNNRKNRSADGPMYPDRSLSSKRWDRIFLELVHMLKS